MEDKVIFYEKPGCKGNARQKEVLTSAGYLLDVKDILSTTWDRKELLLFFENKKIHDCVNLSAPVITREGLDIYSLKESDLLDRMISEPILIKRPLILYKSKHGVGFDCELVESLLGEKQSQPVCYKKC